MTRYMLAALIAVATQTAATPALAQSGIALGERPIRRAEVTSFVQRQFAQMDTNRNGSVSPAEHQAYRARQASKAQTGLGHIGRSWFEKSDADGDGRISPAEAQARPLQFFDLADVDNDGVATVREQSLASLLLGR